MVAYNGRVAEYRIDDLARAADTTVRNVRAYQDRGLLAPPRRQGRVALYDDRHLARLKLINQLLDRGYPLGAIRELTEAWDGGRSLGAVLGLVSEMRGPWSDEVPERLDRPALLAMFAPAVTDEGLAAAVAFGLVEPDGDGFRVPSPRLLAAGRELYAAGVPITAILEELARLRADMERIAARFVELAARPVLERHLEVLTGDTLPPELSALVARLRPLAQAAVDAELARAMREHAGEHMAGVIRRLVGEPPLSEPPPSEPPLSGPPAPRRPERIDIEGA
jgi:DNA-binding transcriptional MerR regulator